MNTTDETCGLCGRVTYLSRIQREPPVNDGIAELAATYCLHQHHQRGGPDWPPCERLGVERIAKLEDELAAERARTDALMAAVVGSNGTNDSIRAINSAIDACNVARPCVSPASDVTKPK